MTNQLEATLGVLKDVSADAVGALQHGWEVFGETVTDGVDRALGHEPPPSHKGRWATLLLAAGAIVMVLLVLRSRRSSAGDFEPDRTTA